MFLLKIYIFIFFIIFKKDLLTNKKFLNWAEENYMEEEGILNRAGSIAFIIGILIALVIGIIQAWTTIDKNQIALFSSEIAGIIAWLLVIIGLIIGILAFFGMGTITKKETPGFLIAGIALVVMYGVFKDITIGLGVGSLLSGISLSLSLFVAPIVGILSIKTIWDLGKD